MFDRLRSQTLPGVCLCLCAAASMAAQPGPGFLGRTLADVQKTEFFTFFNLAEAQRRTVPEGTQVIFQPGGAFRQHVRVMTRIDEAGKVTRIEAGVSRAFIDGNTRAFARDFVRSFLRDASPAAHHETLAAFIKELEAAAASEKPSNPYRVFAGSQNFFMWPGPKGDIVVTIENAGDAANAMLLLAVKPAREFVR